MQRLELGLLLPSARWGECSGEAVLVHHHLQPENFRLLSQPTRLTLGSLDKELQKNPDGSVDIYIGPKPRAGKESNWLYTPAGQKWFPWFRVYGPEKAIMDKSWKLPDIEKVS